jgi:hypothetical protein
MKAQERPVSSGGEAKGTGGSISFSIGQMDYVNVNSSTAIITQGVQQPEEILVYPGDKPIIIDRDPDYVLYPNPVVDQTVLYVDQPITKKISYILYDILGRLIVRERLIYSKTTIEMSQFSSAVYLLYIVEDDTDKIVKKFKIIKTL